MERPMRVCVSVFAHALHLMFTRVFLPRFPLLLGDRLLCDDDSGCTAQAGEDRGLQGTEHHRDLPTALHHHQTARGHLTHHNTTHIKSTSPRTVSRSVVKEFYCNFVFFQIVSDFSVGSMFPMRRLHLIRSCVSSPDSPLSPTCRS